MKHLEKLNNSKPFLKVLLIGFIIILLQIPVAMLRGVIWEREGSRDMAVEDVTSKWGNQQNFMGPVMAVPYRVEVKPVYTEDEKKKGIVKESTYITRHAMFLPETLKVDADVKSKVLHRGIYDVPVYSSELELRGRFNAREFAGWDIADKDILWHRATVNFLISDARALSSATDLTWGKDTLKLEPGAKFSVGTGVHAKLTKEQAKLATRDFAMSMKLKGSGHLQIAPMGSQTSIHMTSDWPDPSFQGNWLPVERKVNEVDVPGFEAQWEVNLLGRNFPERWLGIHVNEEQMAQSYMGVRFKVLVDEYSMALRSVKYDILFMILVFMTLWMFEVLSGIRIHAIQYVLVGAAMCMFYLLELSLAEHIGFLWAYCTASFMVCALVAGYCKTVLQTGGRAAVVGGVLSLLYAYLYMLLVNQGYALLAGSMGLFVVLAAVMFLTRNVDWAGEKEAGAVTAT